MGFRIFSFKRDLRLINLSMKLMVKRAKPLFASYITNFKPYFYTELNTEHEKGF